MAICCQNILKAYNSSNQLLQNIFQTLASPVLIISSCECWQVGPSLTWCVWLMYTETNHWIWKNFAVIFCGANRVIWDLHATWNLLMFCICLMKILSRHLSCILVFCVYTHMHNQFFFFYKLIRELLKWYEISNIDIMKSFSVFQEFLMLICLVRHE